MNMALIKQAISNRVESSKEVDYSAWTIGITQDPDQRRNQHKSEVENIKHWTQGTADSLSDAQAIESLFINDKHMKGGTGGNLVPGVITHVYIY